MNTGITQCHECDAMTARDVRPRTLTYKGRSETVDMAGWYCDGCGESVHSGADMAVSGLAVGRLKALDEIATSVTIEQARARSQRFGVDRSPFEAISKNRGQTDVDAHADVVRDGLLAAGATLEGMLDELRGRRGEDGLHSGPPSADAVPTPPSDPERPV